LGHVASEAQLVVQPVAVQTDPAAQLALPEQLAWAGALTEEHPYASHW
jgi:hypothetical protein